jgi:hypothetical protein
MDYYSEKRFLRDCKMGQCDNGDIVLGSISTYPGAQ